MNSMLAHIIFKDGVKDLEWWENIINHEKKENNLFVVPHEDKWFEDYGLILSENGPWAAGGAVLNWFQNKPTNSDIDIWFNDNEQFEFFKKEIEDTLTGKKLYTSIAAFNKIYTANAITYVITRDDRIVKLQLIRKNFFNSPEELVSTFDITVCQIATDGKKIWYGKHFAEDLKTKTLRFTKFDPASARRYIKYTAYGYYPSNETIEALLNDPIVEWQRSESSDDDYS